MQVKTNVRAGSGGASGVGKNSKSGLSTDSVDVVVTPPPPVYYPPVGRCAGI